MRMRSPRKQPRISMKPMMKFVATDTFQPNSAAFLPRATESASDAPVPGLYLAKPACKPGREMA